METTKSRRIMGYPDEFWIFYICVIGLFLKIVFDIQHGYEYQSFNLGEWTTLGENEFHTGTLGVIQYFFEYHRLPDFSPIGLPGYECPPLFTLFCSVMLELLHRLMANQIGTSLHIILLFNVIFVTIGTYAGVSILRRFGLRGRPVLTVFLLLTFYPGFYIMGATFNSDAMCFMFCMLSIDRIMSWYLTRKKKNLLLCGLYFGLGLMTSYAAFTILAPIITLMVLALLEKRTENSIILNHVRDASIIAGVLGLWWPVYNRIRFGVPLFYVDFISDDWQKIGEDVSFWTRIRPPFHTDFVSLHVTEGARNLYNIWAQLFKTALFSENVIDMSLRGTVTCCSFITFISIVICILLHIMWARTVKSRHTDEAFMIFSVVGYVSLLIEYIIFCFRTPALGAMNFRFVPMCMFYPIIGMALGDDRSGRQHSTDRLCMKAVTYLIIVFSGISAILLWFYA